MGENRGTDEETVNYHSDVLEAKIVPSTITSHFFWNLALSNINNISFFC